MFILLGSKKSIRCLRNLGGSSREVRGGLRRGSKENVINLLSQRGHDIKEAFGRRPLRGRIFLEAGHGRKHIGESGTLRCVGDDGWGFAFEGTEEFLLSENEIS